MPYKPALGGSFATAFPPQFPDAKMASISYATVLIEHLSNDGTDATISHGTGFCWKHNNRFYLVTARHVLTGRGPFENEIMSENGFIPLRYRVHPTFEIPPGSNKWTRGAIVMERKDDLDIPWLEDPDFQALRTDIAVWDLKIPPGIEVRCVNDGSDKADMMTMVGSDCALVGYPTPAAEGAMIPIWRKGAIASEPLLAIDKKPIFLLDASTSPGFSGSPVFRREFGPRTRTNGTELETDLFAAVTTCFVGVYAGRLTHKTVGGEVPFVFYGNRIPIILSA